MKTKKTREIERLPPCPELTQEQIGIITETVFCDSNQERADLIFVFGSSYGEWEQVAKLYKDGYAPLFYVAGGVKANSGDRSLSSLTREALVTFGVPIGAIVIEENSQNTLEDALFAREIFLSRNIQHKKIIFACKAPHSGRCLRTLKKVFPQSKLFCFVYDFLYHGELVTAQIKNTWWQMRISRSYVWGEYQRIKLYSSRGDIA